VDDESPPSNKLFDPRSGGNSDVRMLAKRRMAAQTQAAAPQIQVSFDGLADVMRALRSDTGDTHPQPATQANSAPITRHAQPECPKPRPRMALAQFCQLYELSASLQQKLEAVDVTGPHTLRLIDNAALTELAKLSIGELAALRDAEERWVMDDDEWNAGLA
jgi:hypothetical protein